MLYDAHARTEIIEQALFTGESSISIGSTTQDPASSHIPRQDDQSTAALSLLAREIQRLNNNICALTPSLSSSSTSESEVQILSPTPTDQRNGDFRPGKRQRRDTEQHHSDRPVITPSLVVPVDEQQSNQLLSNLLGGPNLNLLLDAFSRIYMDGYPTSTKLLSGGNSYGPIALTNTL